MKGLILLEACLRWTAGAIMLVVYWSLLFLAVFIISEHAGILNAAPKSGTTLPILGSRIANAQFTPLTDHRAGVLLEGNFQSCLEDDGEYGEQRFDYAIKGRTVFVLDMGPRDEFALFKGPQGEEHIPHTDKRNLLGPAFHLLDVPTWRGARNWAIASLGVFVSIVQGGGSRDECYSYWVLVEQQAGRMKAGR